MLRGSDVDTMMTRVATALSKQRRSNDRGPLYLSGPGEDEFGIGSLRTPANLSTDFQASSSRPVIGRIVTFLKKVVRRAISWYFLPVVEQQSRFNQALLDVTDRMRASHENLESQIVQLQRRQDILEEELSGSAIPTLERRPDA